MTCLLFKGSKLCFSPPTPEPCPTFFILILVYRFEYSSHSNPHSAIVTSHYPTWEGDTLIPSQKWSCSSEIRGKDLLAQGSLYLSDHGCLHSATYLGSPGTCVKHQCPNLPKRHMSSLQHACYPPCSVCSFIIIYRISALLN